MDSSSESPLDVLSRAATMVQNNILPPSYGYGGGGKWRRNKQRRPPPQYSSSVQPGQPATSSASSSDTNPPPSPPVHTTTTSNGEPIDLSTRRIRGLPPPSYSETMQCKQVYLNSRNNRDSLVSSSSDAEGALCDPMIDEHFRRSLLGQGYQSDDSDTELSTSTPVPVPSTNLSVDAHFAKSLGENWLEFLREEAEAEQERSSGPSNGFRRVSTDLII